MTLVQFIHGFEYVFLLYFLALHAGYLSLDIVSLFILPRYSRCCNSITRSSSW